MVAEASNPLCVVLVVEDEWLVSSAAVSQLKDNGCLVLEASSGENALDYLHGEHTVDVLFTDLRLGGDMSGWDVAEAFRREDPDIGVIYTSGVSIQPRRDVPGSLFFGKPYAPTAICEACVKLAKERTRKGSAN